MKRLNLCHSNWENNVYPTFIYSQFLQILKFTFTQLNKYGTHLHQPLRFSNLKASGAVLTSRERITFLVLLFLYLKVFEAKKYYSHLRG